MYPFVITNRKKLGNRTPDPNQKATVPTSFFSPLR
nr:MAG TPA: hypothetical protein [Caudoviricetes sp.]DAH44911.1 MAG TPA: hypothetical protein [Caudoviricetes sp.]DAM05073.1 MAG TPA: hypothetical protein [Caudoviricetes sp.]DAT57390.1 MAG TPA: hypothetical protein [Caudoviricetes sp.]